MRNRCSQPKRKRIGNAGNFSTPAFLPVVIFSLSLLQPWARMLAEETGPATPHEPAIEESQIEEMVSILEEMILREKQEAEKDLARLAAKRERLAKLGEEEVAQLLQSQLSMCGSLSTRYRFKSTWEETDHDLDSLLTLEIKHIIPDTLHFSMRGAVISDIGGNQYSSYFPSKLFRDVYDAYDYNIYGRLYQAYFDAENLFYSRSLVRLGRQERHLDMVYYFDGAFAEVDIHEAVTISAFGGSSVYDFKGPKHDDWIAGAGVGFSPVPTTEIYFNFVHLTEDARNEGLHDDVYMVKIKQLLFEFLELSGHGTVLAEQWKELHFQGIFYYPEWDFQIKTQVHLLVNPVERVTTNIDTYTTFMRSLQPYQEFFLDISKTLGDNLCAEAGYRGRKLDRDRDGEAFNREFNLFYATATISDYPWQNFSVSVSGELWLSEGGGKNDFYGVDAEITYRWDTKLKVSIGTDYALYKYDAYLEDEKIDVYTTFAGLSYKYSQNLEFKIRYEWETYQGEDFHLLDLKVVILF